MFSFGKVLLSAAVCISLASMAEASEIYRLEAYGRDEGSALGNLKMAALRESLKRHVTPEDMKTFAKPIRSEILLKIDDFVVVSDNLKYETRNRKSLVSGEVEVNDVLLLERLGTIPSLKDRVVAEGIAVSGGEAAGDSHEQEARPERRQVMPPNEFIGLVTSHQGSEKAIIDALRSGMDPDTRRVVEGVPQGDPALYVYLTSGGRDRGVLEAFLDQKPDLMWADEDGYNTLLEKLLATDEAVIGKVLSEFHPDFKKVSFRYGLPLTSYLGSSSMKHGSDVEVQANLERMLKLGCDPNETAESASGGRGKPVLFYALRRDAENFWPPVIMESLLNAGADPNRTDSAGRTALFVAVREHSPDHIRLLAMNGANLNAADRDGRTALMAYADQSTGSETYSALIAAGADVNFKSPSDDGRTAVFYAVENGSPEIASLLIKAGAGLNVQDASGTTPLILAVRGQQKEMIRTLVEGRADVNQADGDGLYPLSHGVSLQDLETVKYLHEHGADLKKALEVKIPGSDITFMQKIMKEDETGYREIREFVSSQIK